MAFLKNRLLSPEEQKNLLKIMNDEQPLSHDVKKRLKKLNSEIEKRSIFYEEKLMKKH